MENAEKFLETVSLFPDCSIAVVGDHMLDRYIWGRADRISPEAPVPVVRVEKETSTAGGAANVVRNILSLGGKASSYGIIGDDFAGEKLASCLLKSGADTSGLVMSPDNHTIEKTRVLAGGQQVVRVDREDLEYITPELEEKILSKLTEQISAQAIQGIILEDYAKGLMSKSLMQKIADLGKSNSIPVVLDPHPGHMYCTKGLTLMTPNRAEAFAMAGKYYTHGLMPLSADKALLDVGETILNDWEVEMLLITLGGDGMALFRKGAEPIHIPTKAREVFDVSGAGDTVIATFTLSLLAGAEPETAAQIANHAAGIVVAEIGTAAVDLEQLKINLKEDYS